MEYQKDNKIQTDIYSKGHLSSDIKALSTNGFYDFAVKKTEKLVTALYMVTDCMETEDALKMKLRFLAVDLLTDIHSLSVLVPLNKQISLVSLQSKIGQIISFISITVDMGFVSEMNGSILKKEFNILNSEVVKYKDMNTPSLSQKASGDTQNTSQFLLEDESFYIPLPTYEKKEDKTLNPWEDNVPYKGHIKDNNNTLSFNKNQSFKILSKTLNKNYAPKTASLIADEKDERRKKIIDIIKDKKNNLGTETGVSIKDISLAFTDCSEKTIQRELNTLVLKGQLEKVGEKRWSKYKLAMKTN